MRLLPFDYAVRNLGRSTARLIGLILGSTIVVLLICAASSFIQGMDKALVLPKENRNVILMGSGSEESIERSQISPSVPDHLIAEIPGIKKTFGEPHVSAEIHLALPVSLREKEVAQFRVVLRGVTSRAFLVHPQLEITNGRLPRAGYNEIIVGQLVSEKMGVSSDELALGKEVWFDKRSWKIVGRFISPGTVMEGEIFIPLQDLQVVGKRNTISCVAFTLGSGDFADVDIWTKIRLDLELSAITEKDYYMGLRRFFAPVRAMIWVTALLMSISGLMGGLGTIYSAFMARTREIGMLQAIGYSRSAVLISFLQESLLIASSGIILGCGLSLLLLDGVSVRFTMGIFQLSVNLKVIFHGILSGMAVGLLGAIPPAVNSLSISIPVALRSS